MVDQVNSLLQCRLSLGEPRLVLYVLLIIQLPATISREGSRKQPKFLNLATHIASSFGLVQLCLLWTFRVNLQMEDVSLVCSPYLCHSIFQINNCQWTNTKCLYKCFTNTKHCIWISNTGIPKTQLVVFSVSAIQSGVPGPGSEVPGSSLDLQHLGPSTQAQSYYLRLNIIPSWCL